MGLTPQEAKVVDLRDGGMLPREIARVTGIHYRTVERIVGMYSDDIAADARHRRKMAQASRALLAGIQAAGGHR